MRISIVSLAVAFTLQNSPPCVAEELWPGPQWTVASPEDSGLDRASLEAARAYALSGEGSGLVIHHGRQVFSWGDPHQRYDLKSSTKSFGSIALGLSILDGKVRLEDKARALHPTL